MKLLSPKFKQLPPLTPPFLFCSQSQFVLALYKEAVSCLSPCLFKAKLFCFFYLMGWMKCFDMYTEEAEPHFFLNRSNTGWVVNASWRRTFSRRLLKVKLPTDAAG